MSEPDWSRPHWTRDEAKAMLVYFVFGEFPVELRLDLSAHGSAGLPAGVQMGRIPKAMLAHWEGHPLRGALGEILREGNHEAFEAARKAPECLMLRGELADADSLAYLRDTLGVIAALLDAGGVAVVDPQILEMFGADDWRTRYDAGERSAPRNHVLVLCHDDAGGSAWVKTRGMRKFARPDVSIRRVPQAEVQRAGAIAARLVDLQARGMRFGDGSTLDVEGVPSGLRLTRGGSLDDPEFNNTKLELVWPAA
ncbi:MAG: hypothetical protein OJF55_002417 [Rhodanobacteraceae bacterium]|jgi:hypothetical protein|nr:MAG: hypothetical protein OJF55_002417 [Rhodanobacteraceae bacterium]